MKNILVPVDFSDTSLNALSYAVEVARRIHAKVVLFHSHYVAVETGYPAVDYFYFPEELEESREHEELEKILAAYKTVRYAQVDENLEIEGRIKPGLAIENIIEILKGEDFDLVVMGTHGASGLEEIFLGSFTYKVIEKVKTPILVVPKNARFTGIRKIVYATDFKGNDIRSLNDLTAFGDYFDAMITCLHINKKEGLQRVEEGKMNVLKRNYIFTPVSKLNFDLVKSEGVEKGLQQYLNQNNVDLLALIPQDHDFVEGLFHSSLTRRLSYHSEIPLLVIRQ